jgi:hypothetical protein
MRQSLAIGLVILLFLMLGMWGQYEISPENLTERFWHSLYEIFVLFGLEGEWTLTTADLPIQIQLTRFFAPLVTLFTLLLIVFREARIAMSNRLVQYRKGNLVVGGLGWRAFQFIQTCERSHKVVAVERDEDSQFVERAREQGVTVIIGDVLDPKIFKQTNLRYATDLVAFTGNDGINVELTLKAREYVRKSHPPNTHLRIHLHANDSNLADRLESYPKFFAEYELAEISFFSVYDLSARIVFRNYPPDLYADVFGQEQVHIALYTFDRMATHILLEAARMCHFRNSLRTRFTIFDIDAVEKEKQLNDEHPHIGEICDFRFLSLRVNGSHDIDDLPTHLLRSVTYHVICNDSDEDSLKVALILRDGLLKREGCNSPIMVRMQQSSGLAQLLESNTGDPEIPDGLYPFGMLDQVLDLDNIINDRLDRLAKIINGIYMTDPSDIGDNIPLDNVQRDWNDLKEFKRKQNRMQADHIEVKLRAIRCSTDAKSPSGFAFADDEVELLSSMEQERWVSTQRYAGWTYGPKKVEDAKVNPKLVPWEKKPMQERESESRLIKIQPAVFAQHEGVYFCRQLIIGVTGHRLHKLDIDNPSLIGGIENVLAELKRKYEGRKIIVMSPLAEGADRLVAKIAVEQIGAVLWVPLPLPFDIYATDFTSVDSEEEFKRLVGKAEHYFELPMKFGTQEQLSLPDDVSSNEMRNQQYALAGAYIVERSHELIAVWDGQPEDGTGGTAQVVRWRKAGKVDPQYANNAEFFQRPEMTEPLIISP